MRGGRITESRIDGRGCISISGIGIELRKKEEETRAVPQAQADSMTKLRMLFYGLLKGPK